MAAAFRYVHKSGINLSASTATVYIPPSGHDNDEQTIEARRQSLMRQAYTAKNLFAYVSTYTGTISIVYTSRDSGVNGSLTFTPTTTGIWEDTSNTDTLASGDLYCIEGAFTGIGHAESFVQTVNAVTLENATSVGILLASDAGAGSGTSFTSTPGYCRIAGVLIGVSTEADVQRTARTSATLAKLHVYCGSVNVPSGHFFRTRVNAGTGGQSVTPTAAGAFEDTSNTDTIAVGDEINYEGDTAAGSFTLTLAQVQTTSDAIQHVNGVEGVSVTTDNFVPLDGGSGISVTEADFQVTMRNTNVLKNFYTYASTYSLDATPTVRMRINGTDNALGVSPTTTGVFEDTSNTITLVATDEANYNVDTTAASSGSITCTVISVEETQPASGTAIDGAVAGEVTLAATLVPNIPITAALQRYNYTWA